MAASRPIDLGEARAALLLKRARLLAEISGLAAEERALAAAQGLLGRPGDDGSDTASELFEREIAEGLEQGARSHLLDVEAALKRLHAGRYGRCEDCGQPVDPERLKALPWASRCLACQRRAERAAARASCA